ncbi:MAG TPA: DHH family phosphoesterase, partial [Longimicrobiales bacterium]|nr:DHH family phosphoesterase [Longimicrobiales bacterium]
MVAPPPDPAAVARLRDALSLSRPLCALLAVRGLTDPSEAKDFLRPLLPTLAEPGLLADADAAAERIHAAIRDGETILVHGDYDVDGICGAALLTRWIRELGGRAEAFVPHRIRDGYDFGPAGIRAAEERGAGLVVTVDCGIRAVEAVRAATDAGIDVVVTDHHAPGETLPPA